jgi:hypothetical protein
MRRVAQNLARSSRTFSSGTVPTGKTPLPTSVPEIAIKEDLPEVSAVFVGKAVPGVLRSQTFPPPPTSQVSKNSALLAALKPREVVEQLDKFIVGQRDAKRAVAIALRNRWRRHQLSNELKNEVIPKNILMIGPTGCGKTEIARRIAKLSQAPFIKVEATKFTEVGFHGKDVDQIIRDLVDVSIAMTRKRLKEEMMTEVAASVEERILDVLVGQYADENQRENFRALLKEGALDDRTIEIEVPARSGGDGRGGGGMGASFTFDGANPGFIADQIFKLAKGGGGGKKSEKRKMTIAEARPVIEEVCYFHSSSLFLSCFATSLTPLHHHHAPFVKNSPRQSECLTTTTFLRKPSPASRSRALSSSTRLTSW